MMRTAIPCFAAAATPAAIVVAALAAACSDDRTPLHPADLVGRPAPALSIEVALAGPQPEAWPEELAGRAVVVDFWTTWCVACVEDLPRWNAMVDEFAGQPVTFVAITGEPAAAVERFLETRRLAGWIGLDRDGSALDAFGVTSYPRAALLDAQGVVRGVGRTGDVTPEVVRRLIAGVDTGLVLAEDDRTPNASGLRPSRGGGSTISSGRGELVATNMSLEQMVSALWELPSARVEVADDLAAGRFDLDVRPGLGEAVLPLGRAILESQLGIEVRRETRETDALVLRVANGEDRAPAGLRRARWSFGWRFETRSGSLLADRATVAELADAIEAHLRRPVIDETGLSGRYRVELIWDPRDPSSLVAAVEALGLDLVEERREVEMAVVTRRD